MGNSRHFLRIVILVLLAVLILSRNFYSSDEMYGKLYEKIRRGDTFIISRFFHHGANDTSHTTAGLTWSHCTVDDGHDIELAALRDSELAVEAKHWRWCPEKMTPKQNLFYLRIHKTGKGMFIV